MAESKSAALPLGDAPSLKYITNIIMCICINCFFVKSCQTYQFVEKQHGLQESYDRNFLFPKQTILKNEYEKADKNISWEDWDIKECTNFVEKSGSWLNLINK